MKSLSALYLIIIVVFRVFPIGSLRLYNLSLEDSGIYECTASNQFGQISARGSLTVEGKVMSLCFGYVRNKIVTFTIIFSFYYFGVA